MRTPLTYYGGKQLLASQIVAHMPSHRVYLEPFAGAAAVLFHKPQVERETLNDADETIMRFWRALREQPEKLAEAVAATPYSREEWRSSRKNCSEDDLEAALHLLVNVEQSFSRTRRSWSVPGLSPTKGPWQPKTWANLPEKLLAVATRLREVSLECGDAVELIPRYDQSDAVIYVDPPYAGPLRRSPNQGYDVDDDGALWPRLIDALLDVKDAAVFLSGYPCEETERLGWQAISFDRKRTAQALKGEVLRAAPETLWLSPAASERTPQLTMEAA